MALAGAQWAAGRLLCVGLDSDASMIGQIGMSSSPDRAELHQAAFNRSIVDATFDIVGAYKPNSAFYEARGSEGISDLRTTVEYINCIAPDVPVILDAKRADIGNTNVGYVEYAFEYLGVDAITVHPYLGEESLRPFLDRGDKGIFVLCRTSNPGAGEFQDLRSHDGSTVYETVADRVSSAWNRTGNCGLVVGSTYPSELERVRAIAGDLPILIPGIGAQGGDLEASVRVGRNSLGGGVYLNAARSVIFASVSEDFASAARDEATRLDNEIRGFGNVEVA